MLALARAQVTKRTKKREMFEGCKIRPEEEEDPLLLSRRGSRLAICVTSAADLSELFDRLERVQLDDDVSQDFSPSKSMDFSPSKSMDFSPSKSIDFLSRKSMDFSSTKCIDFSTNNYMDFSPGKSILKSSRDRSRRKSVKFHFADEQTTV